MNSFFAAIAFLTRLPVGRFAEFDALAVGRSAGWFPLVGGILGAIGCGVAALLKDHLPSMVVAALLVVLDALLTGALHMDGLADTADGFGGGRTAEDVLRIMRDHAIGSYGGLALVLLVALKVAAYTTLLQQHNWIPALVVIPALSRWSMLLLTAALPYARPSPSAAGGMGGSALLWGTATIVAMLAVAGTVPGWLAAVAIAVVTACFGRYCHNRIAGITGDTLGANLELSECAALLAFVWTRSAA